MIDLVEAIELWRGYDGSGGRPERWRAPHCSAHVCLLFSRLSLSSIYNGLQLSSDHCGTP